MGIALSNIFLRGHKAERIFVSNKKLYRLTLGLNILILFPVLNHKWFSIFL